MRETGRDKRVACVRTFYRGQMLAARRLAEGRPEGRELLKDGRIAMHTADSFQDSEAEVVILSCVRTRRLGFLEVFRRLNVAITRTRRRFTRAGRWSTRPARCGAFHNRMRLLMSQAATASARTLGHSMASARTLGRHSPATVICCFFYFLFWEPSQEQS